MITWVELYTLDWFAHISEVVLVRDGAYVRLRDGTEGPVRATASEVRQAVEAWKERG